MDASLIRNIRSHLKVVLGQLTSSGGLALQDSLKALDELTRKHESEIDAELKHYLQNRSYRKAWTRLESLRPEDD